MVNPMALCFLTDRTLSGNRISITHPLGIAVRFNMDGYLELKPFWHLATLAHYIATYQVGTCNYLVATSAIPSNVNVTSPVCSTITSF